MKFAKSHAFSLANAVYLKGKNKAPVKRIIFTLTNEMSYLVGKLNTLKDIHTAINKCVKEGYTLEEFRAEVDFTMLETWNDELVKHPLGQRYFKKMELEDILENRNVRNFVSNEVKVGQT